MCIRNWAKRAKDQTAGAGTVRGGVRACSHRIQGCWCCVQSGGAQRAAAVRQNGSVGGSGMRRGVW
jgi:hypothetical protein